LENAGMHINPEKIIRRIREDLEIPGLKGSIIKVMHDYSTMVGLVNLVSTAPFIQFL
jgi:hypothetical protein